MAFQNPIVNPLTQTQDKLLSQLGSFKNILTLPTKKNLSIPEDKQISTFDYLIRIAKATAGDAIIDTLLKKYIDDVFNTQTDKLERGILKGIANSLDSQNKHISSNTGTTNTEWLMTYALPPLHVTFEVAKGLIAKQIIAMIFGPKEKMAYNIPPTIPTGTLPTPDEILDNAVAADSMFSTSNSDNNQFGDQEYNSIKLRERLEKGQMIFTISCQDVKISLPDTFDEDTDAILSSIVNSGGVSAGGGQHQVVTPSALFDYISVHVATETQRINTPENSNAVRKSFLQILVDKIINLLVISMTPFLVQLFNQINTENPALNLSIIGLLSSPKELKNLHKSDEAAFKTKSIFISTLTNALYALLLSIVLKALIKEIKKLIKRAAAKRAATLAQSKFKRLQSIKAGLDNASEKIEKAKQAVEALKSLDDIFNYTA